MELTAAEKLIQLLNDGPATTWTIQEVCGVRHVYGLIQRANRLLARSGEHRHIERTMTIVDELWGRASWYSMMSELPRRRDDS